MRREYFGVQSSFYARIISALVGMTSSTVAPDRHLYRVWDVDVLAIIDVDRRCSARLRESVPDFDPGEPLFQSSPRAPSLATAVRGAPSQGVAARGRTECAVEEERFHVGISSGRYFGFPTTLSRSASNSS